MATRFWVGGTGSWDAADTTHWSATSGGGGGASVPSASDDVTLDASSGGGTVTITASVSVVSITAGAFTGTLNTNGQTVAVSGAFSISGTGTRTITLGASAITCGTWTATTTTNLTFNANTSTITQTGATTFNGGGLTYATTALTGTTPTIAGANTHGAFTRTGTATKTDSLTISANQTVTGLFTATGNSVTNRLLIQSSVLGTARTITAGSVSLSNVDFMDITGAGAAAPFTGTSLGDCLGNSGITFTASATQYWKTTTTGTKTWSTAGNWFLATNGGGGAGRVPLPQDDVVFDENSIGAASTIVQTDGMPRIGRNIDWTGVTNAPKMTVITSDAWVFGSMTYGSGMTTSGGNITLKMMARSSVTITSRGTVLIHRLYLGATGGTFTLQDALTLSGGNSPSFRIGVDSQAVTFSSSGFSVTVPGIIVVGSATASFGASQVTIAGDSSASYGGSFQADAGATVSFSGGEIKFTDTSALAKTFAGGGKTYNLVWFAPGAGTGTFQITGSNTFGELRDDGTAAHSILFTAGTTQTIGTWSVRGNSGALITIGSITAAGHTLSKASGAVAADYLSISRSTATGGASWYAGANSTDGGNNSGWIFAPPPWGGLWIGGGLW